METGQTPIGLAKSAMRAMLWLFPAVLALFIPIEERYRLPLGLFFVCAGGRMYWHSRKVLRHGISENHWSEEQLDRAHEWANSRAWDVLFMTFFLAYLAYCLIVLGPLRNDVRYLGCSLIPPFSWMQNDLRNMLAPVNTAWAEQKGGSPSFRTRLLMRQAFYSQPDSVPPPRPFQLYQYPVKRKWTAEDFQRKR